MALPALATTDQLAAWMQRERDELPEGAALVLDVASRIVRTEARQNFTRGTSSATLYPREGWAALPQRPVISVQEVRRGGQLVPPDRWQLVRDRVRVLGGDQAVTVTYTHGYASVPADVLAVVLTLASRVLTNPSDLRQESVGSVSVTYSAETIGASLAPADRDLLARYRRRVAVVGLL
ncbi:hypothetical protein [Streptomyces spectabilis]|uniref:Phage gp6-like head-tail connector protein n=1 Tax=Streptomyces spectabilis TaxID=68270 RepID=A0A5P2X989_STRST|nr:hypothetical protein [Streptomyces spectabilis]MBB5103323.1 hypothetical protein [Streptomyces spectabilis]MCI3902514.1 hypothetical protein [Streptomyces spectabilis]QEV59849.1 hypothetical protein CP982_14795 [Streptomyces spectabilis]GGV54191.1 hypothetical protein GCM10010245_85590 [Streptomyces spectabilis]